MKNVKSYLILGAVVVIVGVIVFHVAALIWFPGYYVSDKSVIEAVEVYGFTDVKIKDKDLFWIDWAGCGKDDDAMFEVSATNVAGKKVNLMACAGWPFKGVTLRK